MAIRFEVKKLSDIPEERREALYEENENVTNDILEVCQESSGNEPMLAIAGLLNATLHILFIAREEAQNKGSFDKLAFNLLDSCKAAYLGSVESEGTS